MVPTIHYSSAAEALQTVQSGNRIYLHGSAQTPTYLTAELARESARLKDVEIVSISVMGDITIAAPEYQGIFNINSLFVSESIRAAVNEGRADFVPVFLSDIPDLFRSVMPIDVALVQVSP